jgi:hypothetical protein
VICFEIQGRLGQARAMQTWDHCRIDLAIDPACENKIKPPAFKNRRLGHPTIQNRSKPGPPGHWNFSVHLQFSSQSAASSFQSTYTAASHGWPPPARFGPGPALHLENLGNSSQSGGTYTFSASAHIDLYNPDTGIGGITGHVFVDGAWGHINQLFGGDIDPKGCPFK